MGSLAFSARNPVLMSVIQLSNALSCGWMIAFLTAYSGPAEAENVFCQDAKLYISLLTGEKYATPEEVRQFCRPGELIQMSTDVPPWYAAVLCDFTRQIASHSGYTICFLNDGGNSRDDIPDFPDE